MPNRVSFFNQQQSSKLGGWSENLWINEDNVDIVEANALVLRGLMSNAKGIQVILPSIRISSTPANRLVRNVTIPTAPGSSSGGTPDADYPNTALQFKFTAAGGYSVTNWMRGIPDAQISNSGNYVPTGAYTSKINAMFAALKTSSNAWSLRVLDRTTPKQTVTKVDLTTGVVTCPAHGYGPAGTTQRVRLQGFATPKVLNKIWRITVIDADTFQLAFWTALPTQPVTGNNPYSRRQVYIFVQISGASVVRATSHRTGRPTGQLTGRRRAKRI